MIQLTLSGRLGKDAEVKTFEGGKSVINFSVACDIGFGDKKETLWVDCAKWGEKTTVAQYLVKGTQVVLTGEPGLRKWEGGATITLRVDKLELIGGNKGGEPQPSNAGNSFAAANNMPLPEEDPGLPF